MCGIAGIIHWGRIDGAHGRASAMAAAIAHRGPDEQREYIHQDVAFGFRRLAIVDLGGGSQPMSSVDGDITVIFNGEIYNHAALRRDLEAKGHRFASDHSDTEVLVHGYREWGEELSSRLNGMFAFAIHDAKRHRVLLARDRVGIKPLYFAQTAAGAIVFGSEIRAIHASGLVASAPDAEAVLSHLMLMSPWDSRTPFIGVQMLEPGRQMLVSPQGSRTSIFWRIAFPRSRTALSPADAAQEARSVLEEVMHRQTTADVPIATYLSGGIDSSAITAATHNRFGNTVAYSCIFDLEGVGVDSFVDEREFSRGAAAALGVRRVERQIARDELQRRLDETIRALEYPMMGMAYVNHAIAGEVARDYRVVLSGLGGDEIAGGYVGRYAITPRSLPPPLSLMDRLRRLIRRETRSDSFTSYRQALNVPLAATLLGEALTPEFRKSAGGFDALARIDDVITDCPSDDPWDVVTYADARTYLHGLLVLEDKLSMTHSLEARVPFLDNAFIDLMLDLPWSLLSDGKTGKMVLRDAVRPWLPQAIADKPKMGFAPPDASWYRTSNRAFIESRLSEHRVRGRGLLSPAFVRRILDEHMSGAQNHVVLIWCLLSLDSWCEQHGFYPVN